MSNLLFKLRIETVPGTTAARIRWRKTKRRYSKDEALNPWEAYYTFRIVRAEDLSKFHKIPQSQRSFNPDSQRWKVKATEKNLQLLQECFVNFRGKRQTAISKLSELSQNERREKRLRAKRKREQKKAEAKAEAESALCHSFN